MRFSVRHAEVQVAEYGSQTVQPVNRIAVCRFLSFNIARILKIKKRMKIVQEVRKMFSNSIYLTNVSQLFDVDLAQLEDGVSDLVRRQPVTDFGDSFDYFDGRFRVDGQTCQELHHSEQDGQVRRQMVTADARDGF
jgi:hypothetical protein